MMSLRQDRRLWLAGGGLAAVVLVMVAWFAAISPMLSSASDLNEETQSVTDQNTRLQAKTAALALQRSNLPALTSGLRAALAGLPVDSGLPAFTRQLNAQAKRHKIGLTSITVGSIAPVAAAPAAAGSPTEEPAPEPPAADAPAADATTDGAGGKLFAVKISIVSTGTVPNLAAFLKEFQADGPRRALLTSVQLVPSGEAASAGTTNTMNAELTVFSAPRSQQERAQLQKLLSGNVTG